MYRSPNIADINKLSAEVSISPANLQRVYWLSGTPCGGKTTVSNALAEKLDWAVYHVDDYWTQHKNRAHPNKHPTHHSISRMTGDQLWLRPLEEQIREEPAFAAESFPLILEDVNEILLSGAKNLLVDASVVPGCVEKYLSGVNHIFYLIPTEEFQRYHYSRRPSIHATLAKTSNPELAFSNWMARDAAYARWLEKKVDRYEFKRLLVDGVLSTQETTQLILEHFRAVNS